MVNLRIDGKLISVKEGTTILEAARKLNIDIPTLCYLKEINEVGDCRMCIVEIEGKRGFSTSCIQKVEEGMIVHTNTPEVLEARKTILDLIISNHHRDCLTCIRNGSCELQELAKKFNMINIQYEGEKIDYEIDNKSSAIVRNLNKCILCRRCIGACENIQDISAIACINRGFESCVSTAENCSLEDVNCTFCGQCIEACPTGALYEKDDTEEVWLKLNDPEIYTVVQTAPAVRVALGEEFGLEIGTNVKGKMITALKNLGFNKVFDTNIGADITIMEEANEFLDRIKNNGKLPMITSCSPAWIRFAEKNYPELLGNISTCKSPHQMFGALIKSYFAQKYNIDPNKIYMVSVMPCIAKKYECKREEMQIDGICDVDAVITTRELARMIKQANLEFLKLEDSEFDEPMGEASGAAAIFGTTGGVMEAALRTVADTIENKDLEDFEYKEVRGEQGIKRATVNIGGKEFNVVVANGLKNARIIMEEIKNKKANYQFVEIMSCPGGCVMGGGQPIKKSKIQSLVDIRKLRAESLYSIDEKSINRKAFQNPTVRKIYGEFLEKPGSEVAHKYLHTTYNKSFLYK